VHVSIVSHIFCNDFNFGGTSIENSVDTSDCGIQIVFYSVACRQTKSVDRGPTSLDHRHHLLSDESASSYQSPSSLSSTSDVDARSSAAWHTPLGSPRPPAAGHDDPVSLSGVDHPGYEGPGPPTVASSNGNVVDEHSSSVCKPRQLTSSDVTADVTTDVTATATEQITDNSSQSDVECGEYKCL